MPGARRRSARVAATHQRSIYAEPDTEDDVEGNSSDSEHPTTRNITPTPVRATGASRRRQRNATARPSNYVEPATDDDFEAPDVEENQGPASSARAIKRRKITHKSKPQTRTRASGVRSGAVIARPRRPNSQALPEKTVQQFFGPSDHQFPDWTALPVNILKDIFVYCACDEDPCKASSEEVDYRSWLLQAAKICRAFVQPALEAYYQLPRFYNQLQPHLLLSLLRKPNETRLLDYNVKIKSLHIDVALLARVAHLHALFDLSTLVEALPQLQHCQVFSQKHSPSYRLTGRARRWSYPMTSLIRVMTDNGIKLKTWRWSREMIDKEQSLNLYGTMTAAHTSTPFERLEQLVVCDFNFGKDPRAEVPDVHEDEATAEQVPQLAAVIALLPSLRNLSFISCDMIMDQFLQYLPTNLQRLELTNCLEITSDIVRDFFRTSGNQLRQLVLNHNPALTLSFLTSLKDLCPRLEVLRMHLMYYSERDNTDDSEPLYDALLTEGEIPTWPSKLRDLELLDAHKWTGEAAGSLFSSLVDSAPDLPDLRRLVVHAHIDIPWRDRSSFRGHWIRRLNRVFSRPWTDPNPHRGSLKQFRLWKEAQATARGKEQIDMDELAINSADDDYAYSRHLIAELQASPQVLVKRTRALADVETDPISSVSTNRRSSGPRRSKRVADNQTSQMSRPEPSHSTAGSEDDDDDDDDGLEQPEKFIHGLCELVDVRIDNQRPREVTFTEAHFLDSEKSGDEDWNENAEEDNDDRYAW